MEPKGEARSKTWMKVVWVPGHPVMTVTNVWICVMPCPVQELHWHNVIRNVYEHHCQANWNMSIQFYEFIIYVYMYDRGLKSKAAQLSAAMYFIQQHWMQSLKLHIQSYFLKSAKRWCNCSLFIISKSHKRMMPVKTWLRVEVCSVIDCLQAEVTTAN